MCLHDCKIHVVKRKELGRSVRCVEQNSIVEKSAYSYEVGARRERCAGVLPDKLINGNASESLP